MPPNNPHSVLGITKYYTQEELRFAYKRLMRKHHPDSGDGNTQKLDEARDAYKQLKGSKQDLALTVPIIVTITQEELVAMLGKNNTFEYHDVLFDVMVPYETRMGDTISVKNILPDTVLKIKFRENK